MSNVVPGFVLFALFAASCSGGDNRPPPPGGDGDADADTDADSDSDSDADDDADCIDYDDDGFGIRCDAGSDCDDYDADVALDCGLDTCEAGDAREDCPCVGTEERADCHSDELFLDERTGRWRCLRGYRYCEDGGGGAFAWGECQLVDEFVDP